MDLGSYLTFGWGANPEGRYSAARIHREAINSEMEYNQALSQSIMKLESNNFHITGLELLFRKRTNGFGGIKKFIGGLAYLAAPEGFSGAIVCEIDAFAYSFLKGAKNFDLLLPRVKEHNPEFMAEFDHIRKRVKKLEAFERGGESIDNSVKHKYLATRSVMMRLSARDERRALATLLVSGPSTIDEISADLGLNYSLGQRTLSVFESIGLIGRRENDIFFIELTALPIVVFCLREAMGIDLLTEI